MDTITATLAKRVDTARREQGVAILPLSAAVGIPRTTLIRQLAGDSAFTVAQLVRIAHHLNRPVGPWINDLGTVAA